MIFEKDVVNLGIIVYIKVYTLGGNENMKNPIATIDLDDGRSIRVELYPDIAPNTVNNFIELANSGQYDGLTIHRIVKEFVLQSGSFTGTCEQENEWSIKGEFSENGFENPLKHETGVISMARDDHFDSAATQWFIMHRPAERLDGKYAAFGKVVEGLEIVEELGYRPTDETPGKYNPPLTPIYTVKVRVELNDWEYTKPERIVPGIS